LSSLAGMAEYTQG